MNKNKNFKTGTPDWTWPDWRKAPTGTRFRHNMTGRTGTYVRPARNRHNGAVVIWDDRPFPVRGVAGPDTSYVVAPACDLTPIT